MVSDIIIEIYAAESALLRSQKILHREHSDRSAIPMKMTKVLFYDSIERIGLLARKTLQGIGGGEMLERYVPAIKRLMVCPPINIVQLGRDIADWMIQNGRYVV
jgi:hypothetical protein